MAAAVGRPDAHAGEVPVAYVEIKDGSNVTAKEIMDFAKSNIGERAAIPKEIIILDQIPLTAVGKVFKPALKWSATKQIYETGLNALAELVVSVGVEVSEDKVHGTSARISVCPSEGVAPHLIKSRISEILSRYTIHYSVVFD